MSTTHALVIGGSVAGMCAARVLSDVVDRVTETADDPLPGDDPASRVVNPIRDKLERTSGAVDDIEDVTETVDDELDLP